MKISKKVNEFLYVIFRVLIGFGFLLHGGQKLFGWFGKDAVKLISLMGLAGIIEFIGGLFIIFGLFTSIIAVITALEMIAAYYIAHLPKGIIPLTNNGESAFLYFAAFLVLIAYGAGKFSFERFLFKKEFMH